MSVCSLLGNLKQQDCESVHKKQTHNSALNFNGMESNCFISKFSFLNYKIHALIGENAGIVDPNSSFPRQRIKAIRYSGFYRYH